MNKTHPKELIEQLINQHRQLQKDLAEAMEKSKNRILNAALIIDILGTFKIHLTEHLALENNEFYVNYLQLKQKQGNDLSQTHAFMMEMKHIGMAITSFLNAYQTPDDIKAEVGFEQALSTIASTLNARIETEEEGIYDIYLLTAESIDTQNVA